MLPLFPIFKRKQQKEVLPLSDEWFEPTENDLFCCSSAGLETLSEDLNENIKVQSQDVIDSEEKEEVTLIDAIIDTENFSIMNDDTRIVYADESESDCDITEDLSITMTLNSTELDVNFLIKKILDLEAKYEMLNSKISKFENMRSEKGSGNEFDATIFVNEFMSMIQDMMKTGFNFQKGFLEKVLDEIDEVFNLKCEK